VDKEICYVDARAQFMNPVPLHAGQIGVLSLLSVIARYTMSSTIPIPFTSFGDNQDNNFRKLYPDPAGALVVPHGTVVNVALLRCLEP